MSKTRVLTLFLLLGLCPEAFPQAVRVSAGLDFGLVCLSDGTVWSWGDNDFGQLGNGTRIYSKQPVQVQGISNIVAISAGEKYALAIGSNGVVWAWGDNRYGQLGIGKFGGQELFPTEVPGLTNVTALAAGSKNSLALCADGAVWAWGNNDDGQLGDGPQAKERQMKIDEREGIPVYRVGHVDCAAPVRVQSVSNTVRVAVGAQQGSCLALDKDGNVWSWGSLANGALGLEDRGMCVTTPRRLLCPTNVVEIATDTASVFVQRGGAVYACGYSGYYKYWLQSKSRLRESDPVLLDGITGAKQVALGCSHVLVLREDGAVLTWGDCGSRQLRSSGETNQPALVLGMPKIVSIAAGGDRSLVLDEKGDVWEWKNEWEWKSNKNVKPVRVVFRKSGIRDVSRKATNAGDKLD
ncbi:MAG: hypothetical protein WCP86_00065 [bacterium]